MYYRILAEETYSAVICVEADSMEKAESIAEKWFDTANGSSLLSDGYEGRIIESIAYSDSIVGFGEYDPLITKEDL